MKTTRKIIALLLALLSVAALASFTAKPETDVAIGAAPTGQTLRVLSTYDFTANGFPRIYNNEYSADTQALGYGVVREGTNDRYELRTCGGGKHPNLYAYAASTNDLSSAAWVTLYVDTTNLADASDFSIGFHLYLSQSGTTAQTTTSTLAPLYPTEGAIGYFRTADGTWHSAKIKDEKLPVGDSFCGYIALPLSSFTHAKESGRKYVDGAKSFSDLAAKGYKYLTRIRFLCTVADTFESQTALLLDDLTFSAIGEAHAHAFSKGATVAPTCTDKGYTAYTCSCGERIIKDVLPAVGHTFGAYKTDTDGIAYRLCSACDAVDTDPTVTNAPAGNDDLVTVTFSFGEAGGETRVKFRRGTVISEEAVPVKVTYTDRFIHQFNCWTSDEAGITPKNPVGTVADGDATYYARYLIANYADKYIGAASVIAANGGAYYWEEGKTVVYGNSNMSLYHALETHFAAAGIPAYNNSIAGSTSHEMIEYFKACILTYRPKYIVTNITTNDMAYYNMSEKQIIANMQTLYKMVREYLPDTVLLIAAGNPLPGRTEYRQTIERVNRQMAEFCARSENCEYVDWYAKMLAYAEKYPTGWDTWTHLNQAGLKDIFSDVIAKIHELEAR